MLVEVSGTVEQALKPLGCPVALSRVLLSKKKKNAVFLCTQCTNQVSPLKEKKR